MLERGVKASTSSGHGREFGEKEKTQRKTNFSKFLDVSKKPLVSGIIVLLPILSILFFFHWIFGLLAGIPYNEILHLSEFHYLNMLLTLGFLVLGSVTLSIGIGRFVQTKIGFKFEKIIDSIFYKIPLIGTIYKFTKVTSETVLVDGAEDLSKPVKIDFNGLRVTAFKTGNKTDDGKEILFLPTAPNITTGFVIETPPEKILATDESGKEALTRTLSAGFGKDRK